VRRRQARIQTPRCFELFDRGGRIAFQLVQRSQLIPRDGLFRDQARHLFHLDECAVEIALPLIRDPEIEPRVRQLRVLLLDLLQFRASGRDIARAQQRQAVVQPLPCRTRSQRECLF